MDEGLSSAVEARRGSLDMGTSTVGVSPEVYLSSNGDMPRPESKSKIEQRPRIFARR